MRTSVITLIFIILSFAALVFVSGCAPKSKPQEGSTRLRTTDDYYERGGTCNPCVPTPIPPKW